jgi:hypothetical protein
MTVVLQTTRARDQPSKGCSEIGTASEKSARANSINQPLAVRFLLAPRLVPAQMRV